MRVSFVVSTPVPRGARTRFRQSLKRIASELGLERKGVAVLLTDDDTIASYNARWRRKNRPTDVLSFDGDGAAHLGDLIVSVDRARVQAAEAGHDLEDEIEILLLHGVLHLLGHDHETDDGQMRRLEARLARILLGRRALIERQGSRPGGVGPRRTSGPGRGDGKRKGR